jgi:hypothetical protein
MGTENPRLHPYQMVVEQARDHTYSGLIGELTTSDATIQLVLAALTAFAAGLSREDITTALIEGEARGITLYRNLQAVPDRAYWQAVQEEAERFWSERSSYGV